MHFWQFLGLPVVLVASVSVHDADQRAISHNDQTFRTSKFDTPASHLDPTFGYDSRYMTQRLSQHAHREASRILLQAYLYTCRELQVPTWLMDVSLLGWWWGGKMVPWDFTNSVQILEPDLHFLAAYHNASIHFYNLKSTPKEKRFLLEISPEYGNREKGGVKDVADGRWTDLSSGLYMNITAARYDPNHPNGEGMLYTKSGQEYHDTLLHPLRNTSFEGADANIPFRYKQVLTETYGDDALTKEFYTETLKTQGALQGPGMMEP